MFRKIVILSAALAALAGCNRANDAADAPPPQLGDLFEPSHFLQFFNHQPTLAAGDFSLVVAPAAGGTNGTYALTVTFDDGRRQRFPGAWTVAADPDPFDADNPSHGVTLQLPGGLKASVTGSAAACLYLLDRNANILFRSGDADESDDDCDTGAAAPALDLPRSHTDSVAYAQAFYDTIDPCDERGTLPAWKTKNGFDAGDDVHVIFRDTKDLGYGRNMHFRANADGSYAFFVENYQVRNVPGDQYGPLNLDAAVAEARKHHIGTNAIEWGPVDRDGDCDIDVDDDSNGDGVIDENDFFARHYTFDPGPVQTRRLVVDLDGKGPKAMPVPCTLCHGGRADPLLPDGSFPRYGDTKAKLQPLDVGSFEFSDMPGWTRADQEAALKAINQAVYDSYKPYDLRLNGDAECPQPGMACPPPGEWSSALAREMIEDWYGGVTGGVLNDAVFDDAYVPDGWTTGGGAPAGAEAVYTDVVAQNCRTCHLLRGIGNFHNDDIDFTTYAKFIGHDDQLEHFVYNRGIMPLAFLAFRRFWNSGAPSLLAAFLEANASGGFGSYAPDGVTPLRPGRPIANAGPDRTSPSPVTVSGSASLFADDFLWEIVSGPGVATLSSTDTVRTELTAGTDGDYELRLTVRNRVKGTTDSDTVTVTIDSGATDPRTLTFDADVRPLLTSLGCTGCHVDGGSPQPPVSWTDPAMGENRDLYTEFRARVDFVDPLNSRVLRKPAGYHHGGGLYFAEGSATYDTILDWILEGAPEN